MLTLPMFGGLLLLCGIVYMAGAAIYRGRMSDAHLKSGGTPTLEPRQQSFRFLGVKANWPALLMILIGAVLLLVPPLLQEPPIADAPAPTQGQ